MHTAAKTLPLHLDATLRAALPDAPQVHAATHRAGQRPERVAPRAAATNGTAA